MYTLRITLIEIVLAVALVTNAADMASADDLLTLKCDWIKSTNLKTAYVERVSGSSMYTYEPLSDITGLIKKEGFNETFIAGMKDKYIEGSVHYKENNMSFEQHVQINRNTGVIRSFVQSAKERVLLEGKCIRVSGPSFGGEPGESDFVRNVMWNCQVTRTSPRGRVHPPSRCRQRSAFASARAASWLLA